MWQSAWFSTRAFICDSIEGYDAAMKEHRAEVDIVPVVQVSEMVVERSDR